MGARRKYRQKGDGLAHPEAIRAGGRRTIRPGDLIRLVGSSRLFRVRQITQKPDGRTWLDLWGPVTKTDLPHPKAKARSVYLDQVAAKARVA